MLRIINFNGSKLKPAGCYLRMLLAILLIVSALVNVTFAWLASDRENRLYSNSYVTVSSDDLLMEIEGGKTQDSFKLTDLCDELSECSSVDGRNFFFPLSDYDTFRKGNINDRNSKYISMEFYLTSDRDTSVWLSNESYIFGTAADAIRISIDYDQNEDPKIFDSSMVDPDDLYSMVSGFFGGNAVSDIYETGYPICQPQTIHPLNEFYYTGNEDNNFNVTSIKDNPVFTLEAGVSRKIVLNIWLEGTDDDCDSAVYGMYDLQINLRFTAGLKEPRVIKFSDYTFETWAYLKLRGGASKYAFLGDQDDYVDEVERRVFIRDTDTGKLYAMVRDETEEVATTPTTGDNEFVNWTATLPGAVKNIEFARVDYHNGALNSREQEWEFWKAGAIKIVKGTPNLRFLALDCGLQGDSLDNNGIWTNSTSIMTVYLRDNALPQKYDTTIEYYVNFGYYGTGNFTFTMNMSHVSSENGSNLYAARIVAAAYQRFAFRHSGTSVAYTGLGRSNRNYNLYTTTYNASTGKYTGAWSVDSAYPIR